MRIFKYLSKKFFIRFFLILISIIIIQKIFGVSYISDGMALGAMAYVATLIGLNSKFRNNGNA